MRTLHSSKELIVILWRRTDYRVFTTPHWLGFRIHRLAVYLRRGRL